MNIPHAGSVPVPYEWTGHTIFRPLTEPSAQQLETMMAEIETTTAALLEPADRRSAYGYFTNPEWIGYHTLPLGDQVRSKRRPPEGLLQTEEAALALGLILTRREVIHAQVKQLQATWHEGLGQLVMLNFTYAGSSDHRRTLKPETYALRRAGYAEPGSATPDMLILARFTGAKSMARVADAARCARNYLETGTELVFGPAEVRAIGSASAPERWIRPTPRGA